MTGPMMHARLNGGPCELPGHGSRCERVDDRQPIERAREKRGWQREANQQGNEETDVADQTSDDRYLAGPGPHLHEIYLDCYRNDPSIETTEAAASLASAIDHWLCGSNDDGDEGQEYILAGTVQRAALFIAGQPCQCTEDVCDRCRAIGCGYGEHRLPTCRGGDDRG